MSGNTGAHDTSAKHADALDHCIVSVTRPMAAEWNSGHGAIAMTISGMPGSCLFL
jgi:hypothetical protein